jgi:hypothetical protein
MGSSSSKGVKIPVTLNGIPNTLLSDPSAKTVFFDPVTVVPGNPIATCTSSGTTAECTLVQNPDDKINFPYCEQIPNGVLVCKMSSQNIPGVTSMQQTTQTSSSSQGVSSSTTSTNWLMWVVIAIVIILFLIFVFNISSYK